MQYTEQPTPPFNSPYQTHAPRTDSLLEPPYLSPSRHESTTKYLHGLGLYGYNHQAHTTLPPSPSPSDSWSSHVSSASPLMAQVIVDPYASGAFEHPIIRSPQPWEGAHLSPRSSVSPTAVGPSYSHTGAENAYHEMTQDIRAVNLEGHGWPQGSRYVHSEPTLPSLRHHPLTVAPERLTSTIHPYEHVYSSNQMAPTPSAEHENRYTRGPSEKEMDSGAGFPKASAHPVRRQHVRKRQTSTPVIYCTQCPEPKGFARNYNYKKHLETHIQNRLKPHVCHYGDCDKAFVRKTDLDRHYKSVHAKVKDQKCLNCPAIFSRKDTCGRHARDGCTQRGQVTNYRSRL
ncbi:epithelial zinc-finger ezf protein-like protein [Stagonosporopsis vannaccii]|nr:epithelial zinc-finger ezf protein-like protein [Stagonosporopsis vannaccii]